MANQRKFKLEVTITANISAGFLALAAR